jgi:hypothetical protein
MADVRTFGAIGNGVTDDITAINNGLITGDITIQNGIFLISASIKIPSNRTVYIKNAKIKMADESYDNFFRNSDFVNGNSNINIIGQGNACLDGNVVNNDDDYATYGPMTSDTIYRYIGICYNKVTTFEISGLTIVDFPHWFMSIGHSSAGVIHDLRLNIYTTTMNQDGIDCGYSHDIEVYNIYGYAADDFMCHGCSVNKTLGLIVVRDDPSYFIGDHYNINIHDCINYSTTARGLTLLYGDGNKLHDLKYDNVRIKICVSLFYFGFITPYYETAPTKDDCYNITSDGVIVDIATDAHVIEVFDDCKDVTITNLTNNTGKALYSEAANLDVVSFLVNGVDQS